MVEKRKTADDSSVPKNKVRLILTHKVPFGVAGHAKARLIQTHKTTTTPTLVKFGHETYLVRFRK